MVNTHSVTVDGITSRIHQREPAVHDLAAILLTISMVIVSALLAAAAAGKLARLDGATYPTALMHAATAFTTVLALAATIAGSLLH
ncbi:hypothetical protein OG887_43785 (plasmid) [Streptomyces sp. NBC_00053]|uniref:hypothetical protein n=1 Tax=unclassified Streptomyces TaxID=2593676 RepID=UPI00225BCFC8|nr:MULTISPECIES: hypothetical protein [unclassified Streptomyces]MCX4400182.1 hypothetical protein [Streptomyces sp. NBC_01767]MCX5506229.1 hypothetical protein [Streptomyces sp. NBC_00052]MCX5554068.1 hypothetical protein [Streptomyces sp. NBC_00051]